MKSSWATRLPGFRKLSASHLRGAVLAVLGGMAACGTVWAAPCANSASFERWLSEFRNDARSQGIGARALAALDGLTPDPTVIASDRRQGVFSQTFLEFSDRMISKNRLQKGGQLIAKYRPLFDKIEREYGVPAAPIAGFWGLETDFGAGNGNQPTIRSVATLAYDCRRPDKFRAELLDALRIVERGDMRPEEMIGTWAGEIGQTQFVPSVYYKFAVDYDKDGKRDLIHSVPDVLASTANYLKSLGWRRGEPWLREVSVPESMNWGEADIAIEHAAGEWSRMGVRLASGEALPGGDGPSSLLLPMGRKGPAFLAYKNFRVYLEWNQSFVYATTVAYFGTRLGGAPQVSRGRGVEPFTAEQTKELQRRLRDRGFNVGEIDGKLGLLTRTSVKEMQKKFGLPADSYPTADLLRRLSER